MSLYRYETHLHTSEASACAKVTAADQVRTYQELGYAGIIVTDHFFNGNSCIPKDLPWEERIELFCKGYEHAKEEGDRIGLDVFFGWEANFDGTEFLIYGLDKEWMKSQPDMLTWSIEEQYKRVHAAGGLVVHAHPYRTASYIPEVRLYPEYVDAVEALNTRNKLDEYNDKALAYARKHNFPVTAGSDAHGDEKRRCGVEFHDRLSNIQDYITGIMAGKHTIYEEKLS